MALHVGATSPLGITLLATPVQGGPDLSTVLSAVIKVQRPDGQPVSWPGTLGTFSALGLPISYAFAPGDVSIDGNWQAYALLTLPNGGYGRTDTAFFNVAKEFG